jgi:sensor histidine kinase YesM
LLEPRRLVPIVVVAGALVATEFWATRSGAAAGTLAGFGMVCAFGMPVVWRWASGGTFVHAAVYVGASVLLVALVAWGAPNVFGYTSYVAHPPAAVAMVALVGIAGWMLGRDVALSGEVDQAAARNASLSRAATDARHLALRQHLDPHFLFNTLGAIAEWCHEDPAVAERALLDLSAMLRTLFVGIQSDEWPLSRELEVLESVHRLHALRDDERYRLSVEGTPPEVAVPPLVLLPLFENALTHGTADAPTTLRVRARDSETVVEIWNAGALGAPRPESSGIETTRQRLELYFGPTCSLSVAAEARGGIEGVLARVAWPSAAAEHP